MKKCSPSTSPPKPSLPTQRSSSSGVAANTAGLKTMPRPPPAPLMRTVSLVPTLGVSFDIDVGIPLVVGAEVGWHVPHQLFGGVDLNRRTDRDAQECFLRSCRWAAAYRLALWLKT